ncbi:porin [Aquabacterium sp.]|jgi:predicted porin|uniref:porin n=1 Tax=Aquabacterium sp. TaxID=1872578 RepID=UPI0024872062|nr:porin [Aquabacterium sp.]MDI1348431.1 porin [Aquabacterium sp.]
MKLNQTAVAATLMCACAGAFAQAAATSSVTLYGTIDQYLNYMSSSSGAKIKSVSDGAFLRSRIGLKGTEDIGGGMAIKFQLEGALSADTGASGTSGSLFDRQAWVGVATPQAGEFRIGRQNTAIFFRGDYIDYSSRTLGSIVNNFGTPSRYSNDLAWISPRWSGLQLEAHYAPGESTAGMGAQAVYQLAADYVNGPFRVGYADITGKPNKGAAITVKKNITYRNLYANYDYGQGKIYATFIRSNNSTASADGNNAATILGNVGALVAGTNADANRFYNIVQLSADYRVTPQLRVGALYGKIVDTSNSGRGAKGGSIGAYYDVSKRTTLLAMYETMSNDNNAGFRPSGSAGVSPNFTGNDVNGRRIQGIQAGIVHRF